MEKDNLTFYRRFRPKQVHALVGQEVATKIIMKSCEKESFHHAYLFYGPYGSGKTTMARLLAAILTCSNRLPADHKICGECPGCVRAMSGGGIDIKEFNGALDGNKDEIRGLLDSVRFSPQDLNRKVFIIDEFHLLSSAAMTALLKPIEEPPEDVTFILCTTDFNKVPPAIESRCRKIQFSPIRVGVITDYLMRLAKHIEIKCDKNAANWIAQASKGSMRSALNTFETVSLSNEKVVDMTAVRFHLGLGSRDELHNLIENIGNKDYIKALTSIEAILLSGADIKCVSYEIGEIFRVIMKLKVGKEVDMCEDELLIIKNLSSNFEIKDLVKIPKILSSISDQLVLNINHQWILESAIIEIIGV